MLKFLNKIEQSPKNKTKVIFDLTNFQKGSNKKITIGNIINNSKLSPPKDLISKIKSPIHKK